MHSVQFQRLVQNRHFQRFSSINRLALTMFLSHPETTKNELLVRNWSDFIAQTFEYHFFDQRFALALL